MSNDLSAFKNLCEIQWVVKIELMLDNNSIETQPFQLAQWPNLDSTHFVEPGWASFGIFRACVFMLLGFNLSRNRTFVLWRDFAITSRACCMSFMICVFHLCMLVFVFPPATHHLPLLQLHACWCFPIFKHSHEVCSAKKFVSMLSISRCLHLQCHQCVDWKGRS